MTSRSGLGEANEIQRISRMRRLRRRTNAGKTDTFFFLTRGQNGPRDQEDKYFLFHDLLDLMLFL